MGLRSTFCVVMFLLSCWSCLAFCQFMFFDFSGRTNHAVAAQNLPHRFFLTFLFGLLGYIYEAFDSHLRFNVALKMEKKDKSKNILKFEYQVL